MQWGEGTTDEMCLGGFYDQPIEKLWLAHAKRAVVILSVSGQDSDLVPCIKRMLHEECTTLPVRREPIYFCIAHISHLYLKEMHRLKNDCAKKSSAVTMLIQRTAHLEMHIPNVILRLYLCLRPINPPAKDP